MAMGDNEGNVTDTLKQRGSIYGKYEDVVKSRAKIMDVLEAHYEKVNGVPMDKADSIAFGDLVLKLIRAAGAPDYPDSFHDLAGYATLMENILLDDQTIDRNRKCVV